MRRSSMAESQILNKGSLHAGGTVPAVGDSNGFRAVAFDDPSLYINRELSWLEFNRRVLEEARDPQVPLMERLKFLAIFGSNIDEFFMVRVGGLQQKVQANVGYGSGADRMPVKVQLERIGEMTHE